ncbi:MAG: RagB/SusD family nutrient uptake outer membrane protein [Bacteroidetes bacterium]|nr:RagB/SusD family nutrient uptake outer membrane protein [Bacteroidota bacterium]
MKQISRIKIIVTVIVMVGLVSCTKDLDREPFYGINASTVYNDAANYKKVLAKVYASLAVTGNQGPSGNGDLTGFDEGSSGLLRCMWNLQELSTDEAVCGWNDPGIPELHNMTWDAENPWSRFAYYRLFVIIPLCNEFIRESADEKLEKRGFTDAEKAQIKGFANEARFVRALAYFYALDLYGNVPFVTEEDLPGSGFPKQITRIDLFKYVEDELKEIEGLLVAPKANEYGRADKAAAWALLSRLYLNAEVYAGTPRYADAAAFADKVITNGAFQLEGEFKNSFNADNEKSTEVIFPVTYDGKYTTTYGGTNYIIHAMVGATMTALNYGINSGWGGLRTTSALVNKFDTLDTRYMFYSKGHTLEITSISNFADGYAVTKFTNLRRDGQSPKSKEFVDTDYPVLHLTDVYLTYAEAAIRGGGDINKAVSLVNALRERGYTNTSSNITAGDLTLDFILDERARELLWEGYRRTDLIRHGKFTTATYLWPWKGGTSNGQAVESFRNLYPIPVSDLVANTNLTQNPGY